MLITENEIGVQFRTFKICLSDGKKHRSENGEGKTMEDAKNV